MDHPRAEQPRATARQRHDRPAFEKGQIIAFG
jgi:hypothetical protein